MENADQHRSRRKFLLPVLIIILTLIFDLVMDTSARANFGNLSAVNIPAQHPWSASVKLKSFFNDTDGSASCDFGENDCEICNCSGILIDPKHVLTAAHCLYPDSPDTIKDTWADSVRVIPAMDGPDKPYGDALALTPIEDQSLYGPGWINSCDRKDDWAVIVLDRPVGADNLAGYMDYGYNQSCDFFTNGVADFNAPGYPTDNPYAGDEMYNFHGSFDHCGEYLVGWAKEVVYFNTRAHAGQSGSGVRSKNNGSHVVYGVLSDRDADANCIQKCTGATILNYGTYNSIKDFIEKNTPTSADLMPLAVSAVPDGVSPGTTLSSLSFIVLNYSSATWTGTLRAKVYLSDDDQISSQDVKIGDYNFGSYILSPNLSYELDASPPPTIPSGTASGNYYVGVILDVSDSDATNDDASGQDASPIFISVSSPLIAAFPKSLSPSTSQGANPQDQTFEVWNSGGGTLNYSLSDDVTWISLDATTGSSTGEHDTITVSYSASSLSAGTYNGTITVSSTEAPNSPQTITASLTVLERPEISYSPSSLSPSAFEGINANGQTFEVWNSGAQTLNYNISDDANWLSCAPNSGSSTQEHDDIGVMYATSNLSVGSYSANISITDPDAENSPQTIPVTLQVKSSPLLVKQGETKISTGDTYDFGSLCVGGSKKVTFTISNQDTVNACSVGVRLNCPISFCDFDMTTATPLFIPPGGSATFDVVFAPEGEGQRSASIDIFDSISNMIFNQFSLTGTNVFYDVKFNGTVTGKPGFGGTFGVNGVNVSVTSILADPVGVLKSNDTATVTWVVYPPFDDISVGTGDLVEVYGAYHRMEETPDYWTGVGDHWVQLNMSNHYINEITASILYVVKDDSLCGNHSPCYTSIQGAIDAASDGATIRIGRGNYNETCVLQSSISLILQGGWNADFSSQATNTTFIKAPSAPKGDLTMQMLTIIP